MLRHLVLALALLATPAPAGAQPGSGERIAAEFARPRLTALVQASQTLATKIDRLCEAPSRAALETVRETFADLVRAWGHATVLRFGPLAADSRFERLFFWPDPRGIALRQVQQLLSSEDVAATMPDGLTAKSAALQGIPALEFALFGNDSETLSGQTSPFRCRYAGAIARNIGDMVEAALAGWQEGTPFHLSFTMPAPDRDPYRSQSEVDGEIVKALVTAMQFMRAAELLPPLGEDTGKANGRRAPLWRSGLTFALMSAQAQGVQDLLGHSGFAAKLPDDRLFVLDSIRFELGQTIAALNAIGTPPEKAFAEGTSRGRLVLVNLALEHAGELVSETLSAALGLTMGFNALDGD